MHTPCCNPPSSFVKLQDTPRFNPARVGTMVVPRRTGQGVGNGSLQLLLAKVLPVACILMAQERLRKVKEPGGAARKDLCKARSCSGKLGHSLKHAIVRNVATETALQMHWNSHHVKFRRRRTSKTYRPLLQVTGSCSQRAFRGRQVTCTGKSPVAHAAPCRRSHRR